MSAPSRPRLVALGLGFAASVAVLGAWWGLGALEPLEGVAGDVQMRWRGGKAPDSRVAIVAIDEASVDAFGRWPWPRGCLAALVDRLSAAGARTIAFDVTLSEATREVPGCGPGGADDAALAAAFARAGHVVLGYFLRPRPSPPPLRLADAAGAACLAPPASDGTVPVAERGFHRVVARDGGLPLVPERPAVERNLPLFRRAVAGEGFFNHDRPEGAQRHYDLVNAHRGRYHPALALRAVAEFEGVPLELATAAGGKPAIRLGERAVPVDERGRLRLDFRGPAGTFPTYPAVSLFAATAPDGRYRDKLVFVGATETGIGDVVATPFSPVSPGVEVHATAADNMLRGAWLADAVPQLLVSVAALLLLGPLVGLLVTAGGRPLAGALLAIATVAAWPLAVQIALRLGGWYLHTTPPAVAGLAALLAVLPYRLFAVDARARFLRRAFQHYLSPAVVETMERDPEGLRLGGERREMTVLFSDIRGFTSLSEHLEPEAVVRLLNEFFTPMTRIVLAEGGTLDKYMGDAMMAFFGAPVAQPDHARRACAAALAMRAELARLNAGWQASGRFPPGAALGIGIGLASGEMAVGNMGSDEVFDYTVIGDNVNLGSRIEGLNKLYATEILVAGATAAAAGDTFLFRELDRVRVKGKSEPESIHELLAALAVPPETAARAASFAAALAAYRGRDFVGAEAAFAALAAEGDRTAALFAERSRRLRESPPPPDWDGVETMTAK